MAKEESENTMYGGLSTKEIKQRRSHMDAIDAKMSTLKGDMGAEVKKLEDAGGNKAAFKLSRKIGNMEIEKARDFWTALEGYMDAMGIFKQLELFEPGVQTSSKGPADQRTADDAIKESYGDKNNGKGIAAAVMAAH